MDKKRAFLYVGASILLLFSFGMLLEPNSSSEVDMGEWKKADSAEQCVKMRTPYGCNEFTAVNEEHEEDLRRHYSMIKVRPTMQCYYKMPLENVPDPVIEDGKCTIPEFERTDWNGTSEPPMQKIKQAQSEEECELVQRNQCPCNMGGTKFAINEEYADEWSKWLRSSRKGLNPVCPASYNCDVNYTVTLVNGTCTSERLYE